MNFVLSPCYCTFFSRVTCKWHFYSLFCYATNAQNKKALITIETFRKHSQAYVRARYRENLTRSKCHTHCFEFELIIAVLNICFCILAGLCWTKASALTRGLLPPRFDWTNICAMEETDRCCIFRAVAFFFLRLRVGGIH